MNVARSGSIGSPVAINSGGLVGPETEAGAGVEVVTEGSNVAGEEVKTIVCLCELSEDELSDS